MCLFYFAVPLWQRTVWLGNQIIDLRFWDIIMNEVFFLHLKMTRFDWFGGFRIPCRIPCFGLRYMSIYIHIATINQDDQHPRGLHRKYYILLTVYCDCYYTLMTYSLCIIANLIIATIRGAGLGERGGACRSPSVVWMGWHSGRLAWWMTGGFSAPIKYRSLT